MITHIMTDSVRNVINDDNSRHYVGKVTAEENGYTTEFAIKTKSNSYKPEIVMFKQNGSWVEVQELNSPLIIEITEKFSGFLNLVSICFGKKYKRNILFLKDRFLADLTSYRMAGSSRVSEYICLVENYFYKVKHENFITEYQSMPIDMSRNWQKTEQLPASIESRVLELGNLFSERLARSCIKQYNKEKMLSY